MISCDLFHAIIIMSQVFSEGNEVLQRLWKQHNPEEDEYLEKDKVIGWIKAALEQTNALENAQQAMTDLQGLIRQYLSEVHEVTEENTHNLALSYAEGVDFLKWLTDSNRQEKEQEHAEKEEEREEEAEKEEENQQNEQISESQVRKIVPHQQLIQGHEEKVQAKIHELQSKMRAALLQEQPELSHNFKKIKTQLNPNQPQPEEDPNDNLTSNPNEFNLQHLSRKYKDYLRVIFEHYCKASYATGQDPTFQQIMHKTTIMTINKFMMFSKDFQIAKLHPTINRAFLIEIFKKNSECYKEMSYEQFCEVFKKLSTVGLEEKQSENQSEDKGLLSVEMVKLLEFCELSTAKKFKEKMKRLNIQYRAGPKTNAELKVVPEGYRFKFTSNNGKSEEQMKQELNQRKIHRSERKLFLRDKGSLNQNDLSLNRKNTEIRKRQLNTSKQAKGSQRQMQNNQAHSAQIINKILTPIIPPTKKMPPAPPRPYNTPIQQQAINTSSNTNTNSNQTNVFKKDLGYAQLHKIKQSEGYSRKRANTNSNVRSHDGKGNFKLNSIVEEARQEVMDLPINQGHSQHLTESLATNSREETHRLKQYDMNKINHKMQEINDKIKRDRQIQEELTGLLDMDNDEEDEYLMQHLQRQKKNESIVKRLSNKISELERKK